MSSSSWRTRILKVALGLAGGASLLATGTSCGDNLRTGVQAAGVDFVKSSTSQLLQSMFPVKDMLSGGQSGA